MIKDSFEIEVLKRVVEQSPVSIVVTNVKGQVEYVNPSFSRVTGYAKEEMIGENLRVLKSGFHNKNFYKNLWDTIKKGEVWQGEFLNKKKNGSLYWESATISAVFDEEGKVVHYVGSKEDITEKKAVLDKLLKSEMQFRNLAETAPIAIAEINNRGNLLYYNNFIVRKDKLSLTNIYEVLSPKYKSVLDKKISNVFLGKQPESFELESKTEGGGFTVYLIKISPVMEKGDSKSAILVAQDIHELIEARNLLKKNLEYTRLLVENMVDVFWIMDENKEISFVSPSFEVITGFNMEEVVQLKALFLTDRIDALIRNNNPEYLEYTESKFKRKDGGYIWLETRMRVVNNENKEFNGIVGLTRDITERKHTDNAVLESEVKFRSFFEKSNAIILVINPESGVIVNANKTAERFYGYSKEEFLEVDIDRYMRGLRGVAKLEAVDNESGKDSVYVQSHVLKDGQVRDVEIFPTKIEVEGKTLIYTIIQDISQRKRAIEALKESESKKLALLRIIPDLILILNNRGEFLDIYTDDPKRLGIAPYKLLGKNCYYLFPARACEKIAKCINKAIETREIQTFEHKYQREDLNNIVEEVRIIASGYEEVLVIIRDITQQKNNEQELKRAWKEAKKADQVKSVFLANISHEIRTPLNSILGFGKLLQTELEEPVHLKYVESISSSSQSLLDLINDLLDLSKIEAGKMTVRYDGVSIRSLIKEVVGVFTIKLEEKELGFEVEVEDGLPYMLLSDESRLRQILINLLSNAIKFTHEGFVRVIVKTKKQQILNDIKYVDIHIEVEDSGIGIPPENHERIFEAFVQNDTQDARTYGGTGLGLAITKRLVELLNGSINVESELGRGSRFVVVLSGVEVVQSKGSDIGTAEAYYEKKGEDEDLVKVLFVDNTASNKELIKGVFERTNIVFYEAEDTAEAVALIEKHKPGLVIISLKTVEMPALDVARFVKTNSLYSQIVTLGVIETATNYETDRRSDYLDEIFSETLNRGRLISVISKYLPSGMLKKGEDTDGVLNQERESGAEVLKLKHEIGEIITPAFNDITKTSSFADYDRFARLLLKKGREFGIKKLTYIGNGILDANKTFDLDRINQFLLEYKRLIAKKPDDAKE